jgi:hypothetical protein
MTFATWKIIRLKIVGMGGGVECGDWVREEARRIVKSQVVWIRRPESLQPCSEMSLLEREAIRYCCSTWRGGKQVGTVHSVKEKQTGFA